MKKSIKNTIAILCLGIFLYILYLCHITIPCVFKLVTHLDCPGCGVSRMCISLTHGDIKGAFHYNQLMIFLLPAMVIYYIFFQIRFIKTGQSQPGALENKIFVILIFILIAFGILRNLYHFYPLL